MPEAFAPDTAADFQFTQDWFSHVIPSWDFVIEHLKPTRILEVGSFEGRSACYLIEKCPRVVEGPVSITCVDTWKGSIEHRPGGMAEAIMTEVERRFDYNVRLSMARVPRRVSLRKVKQHSRDVLAGLIASGHLESFDLIFIDGSHEAHDVLADAVMAFPLLRVGGTLIFDDYIWSDQAPQKRDPSRMPKPAIDAFVNIYHRKLAFYRGMPLWQFYLQKVAR
ncbi:MAG: class I SAM-dependent methyltransferase [Roseomonas sp.]|nr:class I SAM-dependent methyltransferase [Roseomonas sp.]MCA3382994.1 class I SAM-dependent methyltransferase [Roseomonas sp.]